MDKQEFREQARLHRSQIRATPEMLEGLSGVFNEHIHPAKDQVISVYWPIGSELDTRFLIDDLIKAGHKVALPITPPKTDDHSKRVLTFRLWDGKGDLIKGEFKTVVPPHGEFVEPDIFLIPLLAFDQKGNRMGYGQGHYDTTLAMARKKKPILAIGVGYDEQAVLFNLPVELHDERLDMVLTPTRIFDFR